ncbi:MAG: rhomboid family intramembrane serine protease [Thaumarchaeota archaeon]|nr:rhomboid family intramembrane serine protease [Nitrososphaerota archaeon]
MFPLYDENRFKITPYVTWGLIIANALVFIWEINYTQWFNDEQAFEIMLRTYGVTPSNFEDNATEFSTLSTLVSSMFLHGGFLHIIGNMVFLYVFGDNVEAKFGHGKFLILYLIFGFAGAFAHIFFSFLPGGDPTAPALGASAAISGVLGAYAVFFPFARVVTAVFVVFLIRLVRIPAILYLGFWFLLQFFSGASGVSEGVGYWAHVGGFVAGFLAAGVSRLTSAASSRF